MKNDTRVPAMLTTEQIADALNRTPKSVRRLMQSGAIPAAKVGGRWYMALDSFKATFSTSESSPASDNDQAALAGHSEGKDQ